MGRCGTPTHSLLPRRPSDDGQTRDARAAGRTSTTQGLRTGSGGGGGRPARGQPCTRSRHRRRTTLANACTHNTGAKHVPTQRPSLAPPPHTPLGPAIAPRAHPGTHLSGRTRRPRGVRPWSAPRPPTRPALHPPPDAAAPGTTPPPCAASFLPQGSAGWVRGRGGGRGEGEDGGRRERWGPGPGKVTQRSRGAERQSDRATERQSDRATERQSDRATERQSDRATER